MELTPDEARRYAESIAAVARHYDIGASAKALDWGNLVTTMGSLYGVRVMAISMRRSGRGTTGGATNGTGAPYEGAPGEIDLATIVAPGQA